MATEPATGKRRYRNPLADTQDQFLFFGLFLIGAAAIWVMKTGGFDQIEVTAVPVGLMVFYAIIVFITKRYRLREDRVGDNIYYLGFLYTLVSLSYALYAYDPTGAGAADIITNFGIAISTTILGLAGRVLFNQMREDPVEYEREARFSLAEASRELRSELGDISTELSNFKRKIVQITEEGVVDVTNAARDSMSDNVEKMSATSQEVIEKIQTAFTAFTDHSIRLNEVASKSVEALSTLFERIERIEASPDLIAAKLDPALQKFDEVANEAMRRNRAQTNDLKRIRGMIDATAAASETLHQALADSDATMKRKMETLVDGVEKGLAASSRFSKEVGASTDALKQEVQAVREASAGLSQILVEQRNVIAGLSSTVEEDVRTIRQHRDELSAYVTESRDALQELQAALVSLSRTLVEQLGGDQGPTY